MKDHFRSQIHNHTAGGVVGLGYLGLSLAVAFSEGGFPIVGINVGGRAESR